MFAGFSEEKIPYAVMRNYESLPHSTGGSDLDVLFRPQDVKIVKEITHAAFVSAGGAPIGETHTNGFSKYFAFGQPKSRADWWGIRLDWSFGHIYTGNMHLLDVDYVLEMTKTHNGIRILPTSLASVLGVLKELLHNDHKPDRYAKDAREAFEVDASFIETALSPIGPRAFTLLREICISDLDEVRVRPLCKDLRHALKRHAFRRAPFAFIVNRLTFEFSKVKRFISPPGMMIAVLGTDGAGKSTIIDAITPVLDEATHGAFYYRHLRPGLLPALGRLKGAHADGKPVTNPHGAKPAGKLGSIARVGWLWLDYVLGYWLVVRPKIAKSPAVFLFDRYAHDLYLDPRRFRVGLARHVLRFFPKLVPQPDLMICLHGDPDMIAERKKELPVEEVRRQIDALVEMAEKTPNAILISTIDSIEETRDAVLNAIKAYLKKQPGK